MRQLITFGCSYTAGFLDCDGSIPDTGAYKEYYDFRGGNFPKIYPEILAEENNLKHLNYALGGSSNTKQFWIATETYRTWNKGDIILFQSTFVERYQFTHDHGDVISWRSFESEPHPSTPKSFKPDSSYSAQTEFLVNRNRPKQQREVIACVRGIKGLAEARQCSFLWVPFDEMTISYTLDNKWDHLDIIDDMIVHYPVSDVPTILGYFPDEIDDTIFKESNGKILDYHHGELGNKLQAEIISPKLRKFL